MQPAPTSEPQLADLREFAGVLRRRRLTIAIVTVAVVAVALLLVYRRDPLYRSTARVEVRPLTAQSQYNSFYDLQAAMDTEAQRVTSGAVARKASRRVSDDAAVSVEVPVNTTYLDITCTDPSAGAAAACANAYARAYVENRNEEAQDAYDAATAASNEQIEAAELQIEELEAALQTEQDPAIRASLLDQIKAANTEIDGLRLRNLAVPAPSSTAAVLALTASPSTEPSNKGYATAGIVALIFGLGLGVALAFVRERLDERLKDREHFERALGAPVMAIVPRVPGWRTGGEARLVSTSAPESAAAEAYKTARTSLLYLAREGGLHAIAVTGPGQSEGKTTTSVNIAVTLAQAGKRVIAVSCDLRKPRLHRFFGLSNDVGVTSVLTGLVDTPQALLKTEVPGLLIMPSGPVPPNPAELLASDAMDDLLAELRRIADFIVLDTAPALVVADALGLAPKVDGVIVVADASKTHRSAIDYMRSQLERAGGQVIGGVLNNLDPATAKRYPGYGAYTYEGGERYQPKNGEPANGTNGRKRPRDPAVSVDG